jgi:hypothetical protein
MAHSDIFAEQLAANLPKLEALPEFGRDLLWLTFYMAGPPEPLEQVSQSLKVRGWVNVDGWEGGFLYPKVQVAKSVEAVARTAEMAKELCDSHGVEILNIDADTSSDVERSHFVTLYQM